MLDNWEQIEFANENVLWLLLLPLLLAGWQVWRQARFYPTLRLPGLAAVEGHTRPVRGLVKQYLWTLRLLAMALLIIALARPQVAFNEEEVNTEGIDIMLALDISGSMNALDFKPDRLGAAKVTADTFIRSRPRDRIGLVVFAGEAFTQAPLTTDHDMLSEFLGQVKQGLIEDGTAIGMGLATSVLRLRDSDAESKVIVLLTDGVNNQDQVQPITAAEAAREYGIRVYTIGVGKNGLAPFRGQDFFGNTRIVEQEVKLDEALLQEIARMTGGKYFQATNNQALSQVYDEIDELETTRIEVTRLTRRTEEFYPFALLAGLLLLIELLLRYAVVRSIP
jgi:Ca-activated chloride channel homolog